MLLNMHQSAIILEDFCLLIGSFLQVRSATLDTWLPEQVAFIQCKLIGLLQTCDYYDCFTITFGFNKQLALYCLFSNGE
jgi:hypothetical protein